MYHHSLSACRHIDNINSVIDLTHRGVSAQNQKVWGLIPHGVWEFFLCPMFMTRQKTSFFISMLREIAYQSFFVTRGRLETHLLVLSLMAYDITITRNSNTKNERLIKLIGKWWLSLSVLQRSLLHVHWFTALKVANSSWMASKSLFSASWELSPSDPSSAFYNITTQWKVLSIQLITPKGNLL